MSGYLPDGCTQEDCDRAAGGYDEGYYCNWCEERVDDEHECPACDPAGYIDESEEWPACPTCQGSGMVNPLTAPEGFLCLSTTECPSCEGSGDCP